MIILIVFQLFKVFCTKVAKAHMLRISIIMERKLKEFIGKAEKDNDIDGAMLFGLRAKGTASMGSGTGICIFMRRVFKGSWFIRQGWLLLPHPLLSSSCR